MASSSSSSTDATKQTDDANHRALEALWSNRIVSLEQLQSIQEKSIFVSLTIKHQPETSQFELSVAFLPTLENPPDVRKLSKALQSPQLKADPSSFERQDDDLYSILENGQTRYGTTVVEYGHHTEEAAAAAHMVPPEEITSLYHVINNSRAIFQDKNPVLVTSWESVWLGKNFPLLAEPFSSWVCLPDLLRDVAGLGSGQGEEEPRLRDVLAEFGFEANEILDSPDVVRMSAILQSLAVPKNVEAFRERYCKKAPVKQQAIKVFAEPSDPRLAKPPPALFLVFMQALGGYMLPKPLRDPNHLAEYVKTTMQDENNKSSGKVTTTGAFEVEHEDPRHQFGNPNSTNKPSSVPGPCVWAGLASEKDMWSFVGQMVGRRKFDYQQAWATMAVTSFVGPSGRCVKTMSIFFKGAGERRPVKLRVTPLLEVERDGDWEVVAPRWSKGV